MKNLFLSLVLVLVATLGCAHAEESTRAKFEAELKKLAEIQAKVDTLRAALPMEQEVEKKPEIVLRKLSAPETLVTNIIQISDRKVHYQVYVTLVGGEKAYIGLEATPDHTLSRMHVVINDHTVYEWERSSFSDKLSDEGGESTIEADKWVKFVQEKVLMPAFSFGEVSFAHFEDEGRLYVNGGVTDNDTLVIKRVVGEWNKLIQRKDLMFDIPKAGQSFWLTKKEGMFCPVVLSDTLSTNRLVIDVTDSIFPMEIRKTILAKQQETAQK